MHFADQSRQLLHNRLRLRNTAIMHVEHEAEQLFTAILRLMILSKIIH
jgi:hypothetical protein